MRAVGAALPFGGVRGSVEAGALSREAAAGAREHACEPSRGALGGAQCEEACLEGARSIGEELVVALESAEHDEQAVLLAARA
jgi:hypothetical protein